MHPFSLLHSLSFFLLLYNFKPYFPFSHLSLPSQTTFCLLQLSSHFSLDISSFLMLVCVSCLQQPSSPSLCASGSSFIPTSRWKSRRSSRGKSQFWRTAITLLDIIVIIRDANSSGTLFSCCPSHLSCHVSPSLLFLSSFLSSSHLLSLCPSSYPDLTHFYSLFL